MLQVSKTVTILRPRDVLYQFWRDLENLPRIMQHVESVRAHDPQRSHWVVKAPAGQNVEWDAEIIADEPGQRLSWHTLAGSDIQHQGTVEFRDAPGDRGTEVEVSLEYDAPAGKAGKTVAALLGEEPEGQLRDDLRRFKQVMETGEVVLSDGSPDGAGQGATKQRAAQPMGTEVRA